MKLHIPAVEYLDFVSEHSRNWHEHHDVHAASMNSALQRRFGLLGSLLHATSSTCATSSTRNSGPLPTPSRATCSILGLAGRTWEATAHNDHQACDDTRWIYISGYQQRNNLSKITIAEKIIELATVVTLWSPLPHRMKQPSFSENAPMILTTGSKCKTIL